MNFYELKPESISLTTIEEVLDKKLKLSAQAREKINSNRNYLESVIAKQNSTIYGINTGFGSLCNTVIPNDKLAQLQHNLVISHACGVGEEVPKKVVKTMLFLKIQNMVYGYSGVSIELVEFLIELYNNDVLPIIYDTGSLGASGDLAPLAHLSLPILGLGEVYYSNSKMPSAQALDSIGLKPLALKAKEGLALLNGTQFMSAYACNILLRAKHAFNWANTTAAISLDAFDGLKDAFFSGAHQVRKQSHQLVVANQILKNLERSEILNRKKIHVQDPYSFRCVPQVHGASLNFIEFVTQIIENEISSVTDNPIVFEEENRIISAGNFTGQPLALALDSLAIALAELGSIAERRLYKLISGTRGLPAFLTPNPGINSGFMIAQYATAALVSKNKQLCTPASVDSIDSSNGQEDHVSMGANAATKCFQIMNNLEDILGTELMAGFQALEFRKPLKSSSKIEALRDSFRKEIPFIEDDVLMYVEMQKSKSFLLQHSPLI